MCHRSAKKNTVETKHRFYIRFTDWEGRVEEDFTGSVNFDEWIWKREKSF